MSMVETKGVTKEYREGRTNVQALRGVDLRIGEGEFIAVAGPSGSGKTTLLNIVSGLDAASSGEVRLDGDLLSAMNPGTLSRLRLHKIGFVFQSYNLIPVLTARENVEFTLMLQGVSAGERRRRAMDMLEHVGLGGLENRRPPTLSGGQQQRVAVARAIVTRPRLVLDASAGARWYAKGIYSPSPVWQDADQRRLELFFTGVAATQAWPAMALAALRRRRMPPVPSPFYFTIGRASIAFESAAA